LHTSFDEKNKKKITPLFCFFLHGRTCFCFSFLFFFISLWFVFCQKSSVRELEISFTPTHATCVSFRDKTNQNPLALFLILYIKKKKKSLSYTATIRSSSVTVTLHKALPGSVSLLLSTSHSHHLTAPLPSVHQAHRPLQGCDRICSYSCHLLVAVVGKDDCCPYGCCLEKRCEKEEEEEKEKAHKRCQSCPHCFGHLLAYYLYSAFVVLFQTQAHFNPLLAFYFGP
jgi:hypothetical protein